MSVSISPHGTMPPHYKEVLHWNVTQNIWRVIILNLLALPLGLIIGVVFFIFLFQFGQPPIVKFYNSNQFLIMFFLSTAMVLIVHEWVHGITMQAYGARPKYGIIWKGLMLYASAPGYAFRRNQYLVIALAPLVILSLLACLGILLLAGSVIVWMLPVYAVTNGGGAIGDVWMSLIVLRYPSYAYVVDERDGMRIFLPIREYEERM
jgi:hypothetical protein